MNVITLAEEAVAEFKALETICRKDIKAAALEAQTIMPKIEAALTSPTGLVIESLIPSGAAYAADAIAAINAALPAIKLINGIGDTNSTKGLLQRLGSTLTSIIHGGKEPFTYYVSAFEFVVFGTAIPKA